MIRSRHQSSLSSSLRASCKSQLRQGRQGRLNLLEETGHLCRGGTASCVVWRGRVLRHGTKSLVTRIEAITRRGGAEKNAGGDDDERVRKEGLETQNQKSLTDQPIPFIVPHFALTMRRVPPAVSRDHGCVIFMHMDTMMMLRRLLCSSI